MRRGCSSLRDAKRRQRTPRASLQRDALATPLRRQSAPAGNLPTHIAPQSDMGYHGHKNETAALARLCRSAGCVTDRVRVAAGWRAARDATRGGKSALRVYCVNNGRKQPARAAARACVVSATQPSPAQCTQHVMVQRAPGGGRLALCCFTAAASRERARCHTTHHLRNATAAGVTSPAPAAAASCTRDVSHA